jgi:hypothetical protein
MERLAEIINVIHDAILIALGISVLAFAVWVTPKLLAMT